MLSFRNSLAMAAVFAAGLGAGWLVFSAPDNPVTAAAVRAPIPITPVAALMTGPVIGNENGDVTIISFSDYACTYCKAVEPRLAMLLRNDAGVKLIIKEFPVLTPESVTGAKAALAAARQGKYAEYHQALMNYEGLPDERAIFDTAAQVGLDMERLRADMAAPEIADEILANFNLARAYRIFQTPTFIIGNKIRTEDSANLNFPALVAAARAENR